VVEIHADGTGGVEGPGALAYRVEGAKATEVKRSLAVALIGFAVKNSLASPNRRKTMQRYGKFAVWRFRRPPMFQEGLTGLSREVLISVERHALIRPITMAARRSYRRMVSHCTKLRSIPPTPSNHTRSQPSNRSPLADPAPGDASSPRA
jgi:hypothetical protein